MGLGGRESNRYNVEVFLDPGLHATSMLRSLAIRDFTIVDQLELEFEPGFGAITGETGAGKSILVDALGLLLGDRADSGVVAQDRDKAELSAWFELPEAHPAQTWLQEHAIDDGGQVLLRRSIPANGTSRAWINGQPVTVGQMKSLGALLVEIHGQHEHQRLADPAHQRAWLDRGVDASTRAAVGKAADAYRSARRELSELEIDAGSDVDLLRFQLRELDDLDLADGELEALESEQRRLASIEDLQRACADALAALDGDPGNSDERSGALDLAARARRALDAVADRDDSFKDVAEMLGTARVHLEESSHALARINDGLEADPERLDAVDRRLGRILELSRKHRCEAETLPRLSRELRERLERIEGAEEARSAAKARVDDSRTSWLDAAQDLHDARIEAAGALSGRVADALAALGMEATRIEFQLDFDAAAPVTDHGADSIDILFSANPGQPAKPLRKVASGGELSRLSLAMIIASAEPAEGLVRIFDEIDAGVGGETAHKVGEFLHAAGVGGQAFCVTHLAQVAARADHQFRVIKQSGKGRTRVDVESLDRETRIGELARMLGSASAETSREHAKSLLAGAPS